MATNTQRGEATINLGGADRVLKYDLNSFATIEEHFNCGIDELVDHIHRRTPAHEKRKETPLNMPRVSDIRYLIYVGLVANDPDITEINVGGWIDTTNLSAIILAMNQALASSIPEPEKDKEGKAGNAKGPDAKKKASTGNS
jgi:hypothetical protein